MPDHQAAVDATFQVLRAAADASGYGSWIKDETLREDAENVVKAIEALANGS